MSAIDEAGVARVTALIASVKAAGLTEAGAMFETVYWGWLRVTEAYRHGAPYVEKPDPGQSPYAALHIVNVTLRHWGALIPGTPPLDNKTVRDEAAADEEWHRQEDRRMRRETGEPV